MKSESGETKRPVSGAKKSGRGKSKDIKRPIIIAAAAILSIGGGLLLGALTQHKDESGEQQAASQETAKTDKKDGSAADISTTGSEWGDAYAEYFATRDDLSSASLPLVDAIDFQNDGIPELVLNYSTSISAKTQIVYLDGANKAKASDGYNNARVELVYDGYDENQPAQWYLFNGSDSEYGRYAKIEDIVSGRETVSFISATTEIALSEFQHNYIEINPELEPISLNLQTPKKSLKTIVQRGDYDPISDTAKQNVKKEIEDRVKAKEEAEEEAAKTAEEEAAKKKADDEAAKKKEGITVGSFKLAYGTYTVAGKDGKQRKITLNTDQTYTVVTTDGNLSTTSSGSFSVSGSLLVLGSEKYKVTANNTLSVN